MAPPPQPPPPLSLLLLLLLLLLSLFSSSSSSSTSARTHIPLPLRQFTPPHDPSHRLAALASASLLRARHLKNPKAAAPPLSTNPLFPHSYGGYSITLGFGTPPQQIPLILDTGSDLVWVPCTRSYLCRNCSFPSPTAGGVGGDPNSTFPIFLPRSSTSSKLIGCRNPKCVWIHSPEFLSRCRNCPLNATDCDPACPPYLVLYGSGSTAGVLLSESLGLSERTVVPDFVVGCSLFSSRQPAAGIAGFGRGPSSLPAQLGLRRFSYCLISRRYDDEADESGSAVLGGSPESSDDGVSFTPFLRNTAAAAAESPFAVYYYVGLRRITVEGKRVRIPHAALIPLPGGDGGTIVDSGTTFTYMESGVFEAVARAVDAAVAGRYNRSVAAEELTGLRPCYALAAAAREVRLPELAFHFKGGAEMRLPLANYFAIVGPTGAVCLTVVTDEGRSGGPSIILGSFQQQNYHMVFDLERERLGFRQQSCLVG